MDKEREAHCDQRGIAEVQEGAEIGEQVVAAFSPSIRQPIHCFGRYQLDLTQPPPMTSWSSPQKGDIWFCGLGGPEKGEGKAEKEKIGSPNEAFLVDNSRDGMQNQFLRIERLIWLFWERTLAIPLNPNNDGGNPTGILVDIRLFDVVQ